MHIVLIDWKIIKGEEAAFEEYWRSLLPIRNRAGMIGEFLSEPNPATEYSWINWNIDGEQLSPECTRFINVGLWSNAKAFEVEASPYFDPEGGKLCFEFELRRRALLTPKAWRNGPWGMPTGDSDGVT